MTRASPVCGVFVGGASRRMGGRAKGLLLAREGVSIVDRTLTLARRAGDVVLVGRADAYAHLGARAIADATTTAGLSAGGPLAGLVALLEHAGDRPAIALACDMPYVTGEMLARLVSLAPDAPIVAPREGGTWSPLFARYDCARVAPIARAKLDAGERSLKCVLGAVDTRELPLSKDERRALRDWDAPEDVDTRPEDSRAMSDLEDS